jgi:phosphoribosylglycinamide formyltransferase-1
METSRKSSCTPLAINADTRVRYVDLLATLDARHSSQTDVHHALEALEREGIYAYREHRTPERILAWIDAEFGRFWSSEATAGGIWIAQDRSGPVGFCTFDQRGLRMRWLRQWQRRPSVGVCGPLGVVERVRGRGVGRVLLHAALFSLRERGYRQALFHIENEPAARAFYEREAGAALVTPSEPLVARPRRTTILASGNGSNFAAVVDAARAGDVPLDVTALVVNKPDAYARERAARANVPQRLVHWDRRSETRTEYDARVMQAVEETEPELVLLLGWMHVLAAPFVERFSELLNVHPAFLPLDPAADEVTLPDGTRMAAFRGPHAIDDALAARANWAGASVHRVGIAVDRGAVLARAPLALVPNEAREELDERLHALERRVVRVAVCRWETELP